MELIYFGIYMALGVTTLISLIMWVGDNSPRIKVWQAIIIVNFWPFILFGLFIIKQLNSK